MWRENYSDNRTCTEILLVNSLKLFDYILKKKHSLQNLSFSKNGGKFDQVQFLEVKCCIEIKYIVNVLQWLVAVAFQLDINPF